MFWALMYMLLFGGSADPEWSFVPKESQIRESITSPQRMERLVAVLGEMKSAEQMLLDAYAKREAELVELSRSHDAGGDKFRAILVDLEETRRDAQAAWLESRFVLKQQLTRDEWEAVHGR